MNFPWLTCISSNSISNFFWYFFNVLKSLSEMIQIDFPEAFPRAVRPARCKYSCGFDGQSK